MAVSKWRSAFAVYGRPCVLVMVCLGFSAGLPYLLVFSTLSAWLRDEGVANTVIGFFSWVGVTYSFKVFLAPLVDWLPIPLITRVLGKRRSWMLIAQLGIMFGLTSMAGANIHNQLQHIALLAVFVACCAALQDIVVDAYRIESATSQFQGAMAATYVFGYRLALLAAGAGSFYLAEYFNWQAAYLVMAAAMSLGVITTLCLKEPNHQHKIIETGKRNQSISNFLKEALISPFVEFFTRNGSVGLLILLLIALYKMSDITMGVMANPFYLDLGFDKKEIAEISKIFGFFMTIAGAGFGGVLVVRYGIMRPLLLGAVMVASTNLLFAVLAVTEPNLISLAVVISADNLSGGFATSVFIAYLSSLTNSAYTATQYALFSSLMTLPAQLLGGFSGLIVDKYSYLTFFIYAGILGVPAILLVSLLMKKKQYAETQLKAEARRGKSNNC